jgi:hypothetical protein
MHKNILWLALAAATLIEGGTVGQPVLIELFTSEGCSSCPPADALLEKLDRDQPVAGAQIIVLSEHVDYWNHLGWADPFSSHAFSERQEQYARRFALAGPYTPQMVVDGNAEFVGNDSNRAEAAIRAAIGGPRVGIRIQPSQTPDQVAVSVDPLPAGKNHKATVYVAQAADGGSSNIPGGENRGRTLHHVSIVKELQQVGSISERAGLEKRIAVSSGSRLVVFVQESGNGPVRGAAMYTVPK